MKYGTRADNVYLLDTKMFGYERFHSAYLVEGEELALIDTGAPLSWPAVREAIEEHGFALSDIAHVLVTHAEHPDHSGNVGALFRENERAVVHVSPLGAEYLTHPEIEAETRRRNLSPSMAARFGEMLPVAESRLRLVEDADVLDLGGGVRLRVVVAPGHQPSGFVVFEEKFSGVFINDLCGAYFADAGASWMFTPFRSDVREAKTSLEKVRELHAKRVYLGHYGMNDEPETVIDRAIAKIEALLEIGAQCLQEGRPEGIEARVLATLGPEREKLERVRTDGLGIYLRDELHPSLAKAFARYYLASA